MIDGDLFVHSIVCGHSHILFLTFCACDQIKHIVGGAHCLKSYGIAPFGDCAVDKCTAVKVSTCATACIIARFDQWGCFSEFWQPSCRFMQRVLYSTL